MVEYSQGRMYKQFQLIGNQADRHAAVPQFWILIKSQFTRAQDYECIVRTR